MFKKKLSRSLSGNLLLFMLLLRVAAFMLLPIVYALVTAFKPLDEIFIFPPRMYVKKPTLSNFSQLADILSSSWVPISRYVFNSLFVAVIGIVGHVFLASMAAYPLAKHNFVGKKACNAVVTLSLLFSYSVTYIPSYIVFAKIGWVNTFWPMIAGAWSLSLGLYMMSNFMGQIPMSLLESARLDGCNEFQVWWRIVMPNVKPAWMTIAIFAFNSSWNTAGSTIYSEEMKLMQNVFSNAAVAGSGVARAGAGAAGALILMIPPVTLFLFCQSHILETMTTSGMKE